MSKYKQKYYIIQSEMDNNYRLKPISAIMYFQDCFARYLTSKNLAAFDIISQNLYWIITEFNIYFPQELPFWSEQVEVTTWVSEVSKLKIFVDFEIKHNDITFAKGNSCWVILNTQTKRPAKTDLVVDKIEIYPELTAGEHKKFQTGNLKEKIKEIAHKTNLSDIDFNNHVNNKSYINITEATSTEEFKNTHIPRQISVKFSKESFLNDTLICSTYATDAENTYIHKIEKEGLPICDIVTSWEETDKHNHILESDLAVRK